MKKTFFKSGVVIVAVSLLLLLLFEKRSPLGKGNSSFASEPKSEITKIELSEGRQELIIEKVGENWLVNGKSESRKSGILFITRILKQIEIKSPVSQELFETEITAKGIKPVRVKVFERRRLIKSFIVYKTSSNTYGNIMKIREGSKPFIVCVPGYEGDIGSAFTLNELFWKSYNIFSLLPSEIESVVFENISDTSNSFSIVIKDHLYTLLSGKKKLTGWDSSYVERYLSYFARIPFESWAFEIKGEEHRIIESAPPLFRITVAPVRGEKIILTLWEKMKGEGSSKTKDSDRLIGKTEGIEELFIIRYFDIDPLLKKRSYFYPE